MGVCDIPVISTVCDTAGEAAASLISAPFDWLASAIGAAAGWLVEAMWSVFDSTTMVNITSDEYLGVYNILFGIAIFVMLAFFCLQLITGLIRRDPTALSRAALGLAKSVLGSFVVITIVALLLEITDQLTIGIVQASGNTMESLGDRIALLAAGLLAISITAPGVGAILTIFLGGLMITAAAIVWFSLIIRSALLLVAIVFAPIALAGASWDATKVWFSKWATFVVALIFSKLVLVVIFLVAITQISAPIEADLASIADPIAGIVLLFIAAFAPYMTYKFLSFVGFDMYHAMSAEQEAKGSLNRPVPAPTGSRGGQGPKKVLDGPSNSGSGSGGARGSGGSATGSGTSTGAGAAAGTNGSTASTAGAGAGTNGSTASTAGAGAGTGATAGGGATAGAAAAGPAAAAVVGAQAVKSAATAGPRAGNAVGGQAEGHAEAADQANNPTPAATQPTGTPTGDTGGSGSTGSASPAGQEPPRPASPEPVPPAQPNPTPPAPSDQQSGSKES